MVESRRLVAPDLTLDLTADRVHVGRVKHLQQEQAQPSRPCGRVKAGVTCCPRRGALLTNHPAISDLTIGYSCQSATIPGIDHEQATFHTDQYAASKGVMPPERHKAITKHARKTNPIERFNNTLRQRLARLVRETFSFSKKLANDIGAIQYFICHYNLTKTAALPV